MILNAQEDFGGDLALAAEKLGPNKLYIPGGVYKLTGELHFPDVAGEIYGDGVHTQLILPSGSSGLFFGDPSRTNGVVAGGSVHDLLISGSGKAAGTIGFGLLRATQATVQRVTVKGGFDIGFDLNANCYGSELLNCTSQFGGNNVGLNLRKGSQSGSDLHFANNWLHGNLAAVHIAGGGGGYHFHSGQLGAGYNLPAQRDDLGVVVLGKDYLTGTIAGGCDSLNFVGVSWEGWHQMWALRSFAEWSGSFEQANFNSTDPTQAPMGLWKAENAQDTKVKFSGCGLGGAFTNGSGKLMDISDQSGGKFQLVEEAWKPTNHSLTVNGSASIDIGRKGSVALCDGWKQGTTSVTPNGIYYGGVKVG